jgi:hypothetical protein
MVWVVQKDFRGDRWSRWEAGIQQEKWVESNGLENEGSYPQCILGCCSDREEGVSVKWFWHWIQFRCFRLAGYTWDCLLRIYWMVPWKLPPHVTFLNRTTHFHRISWKIFIDGTDVEQTNCPTLNYTCIRYVVRDVKGQVKTVLPSSWHILPRFCSTDPIWKIKLSAHHMST